MVTFTVNGKEVKSQASADTPLLWVIRDEIGLKGTKFGCGIAMCGACTVHLDGQATRSCVLPVGAVAGKNITTIEGLNNAHPLQKAWVEDKFTTDKLTNFRITTTLFDAKMLAT